MRAGLLIVVLAVLAAGCGGSQPSTQSVVRAWSQALNAEDNKGAADLFAPGAEVVQGPNVIRLRTHADAEAWNSSLPCSGQIVKIKRRPRRCRRPSGSATGSTAAATGPAISRPRSSGS